MKLTTLFFGTVLMGSSIYANKPSFDCSKVSKNSAEGIICNSDTLMGLDREISALYKEAKIKASKKDMLKATQRGWIKARNDCWKDDNEAQCMEELYKIRIAELKSKYGLGTTSPASEKYSFEKTLSLQGITFDVVTTGEGSLRTLYIKPHGLSIDNDVIKKEIDGSVTGAEVANLNNDGFPEVYVYINSAGSGSYGSLVAYGSNSNKSITPIFLPELSENKKLSQGYMGHDEFTVIENSLVRRFPVYNEGDANCCPKGGTRQLEYKLVPGEATLKLKLIKSTNY